MHIDDLIKKLQEIRKEMPPTLGGHVYVCDTEEDFCISNVTLSKGKDVIYLWIN